MLQEEVTKNPNAGGFLFDGFPRTVPQAEALDAFMKKNGTAIHHVIALDVSEAELRARIAKRKELSNRADDEEDKLNKRVAEYFGKTIHVLPHYQKQGRLQTVNGIGNIDEIFANVCVHLDKK
jgi:adenylate kinase